MYNFYIYIYIFMVICIYTLVYISMNIYANI